MSNSSYEKLAPLGSPPNFGNSNEYSQRAPPPSYEESQKIYAVQAPQQCLDQLFASKTLHEIQPQVTLAPRAMSFAYTQQPPLPPPYQPQIQHQCYYYHSHMLASNGPPHLLTFAKGAKIRTTVTGAVAVPPPPPGCAPTPAQLAAMQGHPVVVKKQNNSFF